MVEATSRAMPAARPGHAVRSEASRDPAQPAASRAQPGGDEKAEQFAKALSRHEGRGRKPLATALRGDEIADQTGAGASGQVHNPLGRFEGSSGKDTSEGSGRQDLEGLDLAGPANRHVATDAGALPGTAGATASAEMAAQFAERLALSDAGIAQSRLQLDERVYAVSDVVIDGGADGLFISYGTSDQRNDGETGEEDLRRRLEARGLKIAGIIPSA